MILQILVPQYCEDENIIRPLLNSITMQQNIDFNQISVIIVNDGSNVILNENFLNSYPFEIQYIKNEHKGVSATRNCALDYAIADYIMFCDADDMFKDVLALYAIFMEINIGFQALAMPFSEESRDRNNGNIFYVDHLSDSTFVHGKVYKRQFLIDNHIRWNEKLIVHEDSYFNYLAQALAAEGQFKRSNFVGYLWKWRQNSVCRNDILYIQKTYPQLIDSAEAIVEELLTRNKTSSIPSLVANIYYSAYYDMNKEEWLKLENQKYRMALEQRLGNFYFKYGKFIDLLSQEEKKQIILNVKNQKFNEGVVWEKIPFDEWEHHIINLKNKP